MSTGDEKWRAVVSDFMERAWWSAGQVFFATLLAGGAAVPPAQLPWKYASTLAVSAAVSSFVLTAVQYLTKVKDLSFWPDMLVRLAKTFLSSLSASILAAEVFDLTTFDWGTAFDVAFLATLGALAKGLLAREPGPVPAPAPAAAAVAPGQPTVPAPRPSPSTLPTKTYDMAVRQ